MVDSSVIKTVGMEMALKMDAEGLDPHVALNRTIREYHEDGVKLESYTREIQDAAFELLKPHEHPLIRKAATIYRERRRPSEKRDEKALSFAIEQARIVVDHFPFAVRSTIDFAANQ